MKETIGGYELTEEIKNELRTSPDVAFSNLDSRTSYAWIFGTRRGEGDPPVSIYFRALRQDGHESFESVGATTKENAIWSLKAENKRSINLAESR